MCKEDLIPTHRPIQVCLDLAKLQVEKRTLRKPMSASEAFEEKVERLVEEAKNGGTEDEIRIAEKQALHKASTSQSKHRAPYNREQLRSK